MKKIVALAALAALAACGKSEPAPEPAETVAAPAVGVQPGMYEVSTADGATSRTELKADGTYADIVDGQASGGGKWTTTENQLCFDGDGEGEEQQCWKNSPTNADGSWTATSASGEEVTVRPVAAAAAE